ncbi:MAG: STAS domain-containing protein [Steroidobacter sp.]
MKTTKRKRESAPIVEAPEKVVAAPAKAVAAKAPPAKASPARSTVIESGTAPVVVLAHHCSVKNAAALKDTLREAAAEISAVTIDVRGLERIDTATMQLLCAFVRDRSAREQKVEWLGNSAALGEAARLLGVAAMLALPAADSTGAVA